MTLRELAVQMIKERGCGSIEHLHPELSKQGYTRQQISKALHNAETYGLLTSEGRSIRGRRLKVYWPGKPDERWSQLVPKAKNEPAPLVVSSVFTQDQPITLPPPPAVRKINTPLGPWNTEGA